MYILEVVHNGMQITKSGDSPEEVLKRLQDHLKSFHNEEHDLTYSPYTLTVWTNLGAFRTLGTIKKVLPATCE